MSTAKFKEDKSLYTHVGEGGETGDLTSIVRLVLALAVTAWGGLPRTWPRAAPHAGPCPAGPAFPGQSFEYRYHWAAPGSAPGLDAARPASPVAHVQATASSPSAWGPAGRLRARGRSDTVEPVCQRQGVVPDGSHGQRSTFDWTDLRKVAKEQAKGMAVRHAAPD